MPRKLVTRRLVIAGGFWPPLWPARFCLRTGPDRLRCGFFSGSRRLSRAVSRRYGGRSQRGAARKDQADGRV